MAVDNGVNFFGSWETSDGIGRAAALNIQCLDASRIPMKTFVLSRPVALQTGRDTIIDERLLSKLNHKVNIFQFSARWVPHYFSRLSEGALDGFYNIGYWFCEVPGYQINGLAKWSFLMRFGLHRLSVKLHFRGQQIYQ